MKNIIYINGQIVTVDDQLPSAEAVVVESGKIKFVGSNEEALLLETDHEVVDLEQKTMVPGFVDGHGHFMMGAIMQSKTVALFAPPHGTVECVDDIIQILKDEIKRLDLQPGETVMGMGYDDALLKEKRLLTKDDLDKVSTEHGVMVSHQSGHIGTVNSFLLKQYNITEETENPEGGVICRYPGTNIPNGGLEENALIPLSLKIYDKPDMSEIPDMLKKHCQYYASYGITTAQEGGMSKEFISLAKYAASSNLLDIDVIGFCWINELDDFEEIDRNEELFAYQNHFKIGGAKFFLDGSPQAKTAWLSQPYYVVPDGLPEDYCGYPVHESDQFVTDVYKEAIKRDMQILTHTNGDQASEQLISCYENAKKELEHAEDLRPVMIHAQTVREDQLDRMASLGMIPSFFHDHTFYWGDWHLDSVLGTERGSNISPQQWAIARNIPYTTHQDAPVVQPDMIFTLWAAVNRKTRTGRTAGEHQRVSPLQALKAITINGAFQNFEEDIKGTITVGKNADLVILSENPLKVDPGLIKDIKVLETIKDGETVYQAI